MKKLMSLIMILLILSGCMHANEEEPLPDPVNIKEKTKEEGRIIDITHISEDKKESVYATADQYGNIIKTEVEVILKASDEGRIEDVCDLRDVRNTGSDEEFTYEDGILSFENKGEDIHYKGVSDKKLPVQVRVTYSLDGKQIEAKDLKGKSGDVEIRFDYRNNTGREVDGRYLYDPFLALTVVMLDSEVFSDVEVENGKLIEYGDSCAVAISALPGVVESLRLKDYKLTEDIDVKDYGVIKAKVKDFSLDYTATILTNGLFKDIEDEDLKDFDDFVKDSDGFRDDASELTDNTAKLYDACVSIRSGLKEYTKGVSQIDEYLKQSVDGAKSLEEGIGGLKKFPQISQVLERIESEKEGLKLQIEALIDADETIEEEKKAERKKVYEDHLEMIDKDIENAKIEEADLQYLGEEINQFLMIYQGDVTFRNYLIMLEEGAKTLGDGLGQIKEGTSALVSTNEDIDDGLDEMVDAAKGFDDGMNEFVNDDINDLLDLGGASLKRVIDRVRAMRSLDQEYGCFSGLMEGKEGSTTFIIETAEIK